MSSSSTTEFYGLTQYVGIDKPSFLDNNEAFAAVDAALHGAVADAASQGQAIAGLTETVGTLGQTVTGLGNDLNTEKGKIVDLQNKEITQDAAIAGVKTAALDMICAYNEEAATSTHAYAIGDYFRYNDVLYKATSAIAIGDTIVPNVNCEATNVAEELLNIEVDTSDLQPKEDNTLETTSKEVVGAINEVNAVLTELGDKVVLTKGTHTIQLTGIARGNSAGNGVTIDLNIEVADDVTSVSAGSLSIGCTKYDGTVLTTSNEALIVTNGLLYATCDCAIGARAMGYAGVNATFTLS